jgi:hypothetical protein
MNDPDCPAISGINLIHGKTPLFDHLVDGRNRFVTPALGGEQPSCL